MKRKKFPRTKLAILASVLMFSSCMTDIDLSNISKDVKIDESLVIPVGEANLTVEKIIAKFAKEDFLLIDGDNEVYFHSYDSAEFKFKDFDLADSILLASENLQPVVATYPAGTPIPMISKPSILDLGINNGLSQEILDSTIITSASLKIKVRVTPDLAWISPSDMTVNLVFSDSGNGIKFLDNQTMPAFHPIAYDEYITKDLPKFMINSTGGAKSIPYSVQVTIKNQNVPVTFLSSSRIYVDVNFTTVDFEVAYGNLYRPNKNSILELVKFDLATYLPGAYLRFVNPKIILTATSNIGALINFRVDYMKVYTEADSANTTFYADFNGSKSKTELLLTRPQKPGDIITQTFLPFDKNNGGTDLLFDKPTKPDRIEYTYSAYIDYTRPDLKPRYFTSDSKVKVKAEIRIPLHLKPGCEYVLTDTIRDISLDFDKKLKNGYIDSAYLVLKVRNGMPVKANYTMTFYDSLNNIVPTTIEKTYKVNAPQVDASGLVITSSILPQTILIGLNKKQLDDLKKVKYIVYNLKVDGDDTTKFMHFYKQNTFGVKLGIFVKGGIIENLDKK